MTNDQDPKEKFVSQVAYDMAEKFKYLARELGLVY